MDEQVYWLWLQHAFGVGSSKPMSIARRFENLEEFYEGGDRLWYQFAFISQGEIETLKSFDLDNAEAQIDYCERIGQSVIAYSDDMYPERLRNIDNPPCVLYVKGEMPSFDDRLTISVVGSRKAGDGAMRMTDKICRELSNEGVLVVSGGALGIDSAAHRGALKGTSPTAAILPCGLDFPYLMQNQNLRMKILEKGGALISEHPVNSAVYKGNFAVRNRIISALCNGLLVAEAATKSGTMLTVAHATKQNKDIFVFPGDPSSPTTTGSNRLILDGAQPVLEVKDILDEYKHLVSKEKISRMSVRVEKDERIIKLAVSQNAELLYTVLTKEPMHVTQLCVLSDLKPSQVMAAITELELMGYIKTYSGQRCSLI